MQNIRKYLSQVLITLSLIALFFFHERSDFSDKNMGPEVDVTIAAGSSGKEIANILQEQKIIKSAKAFVDLYISSDRPKAIAAGVHRVNTLISMKTAVTQLLDQKRIINSVVVKEGSTVDDVLKELRANSHLVQDKRSLSLHKLPIANARNSLEGQFQPAIYSFAPGTNSFDAIDEMLGNFRKKISALPLTSFGKYSQYEVLTIASLIQVEGDQNDFAKVASVIYNRLKIGMPLQLNSSVQYAAGLRGRIALSNKATEISSPYNTYKKLGLPPTPICNPSDLAIKAALNPEKNDSLYFITVKPKDTRFTKSFEEFSKWNEEYNNNLAKGLFR